MLPEKSVLKRKFILAFGLLLMLIFSCVKTKEDNEDIPAMFPFALEGISIEDLQAKLEKGQYTSVEIVRMYLKRIQELDQNGPMLRSIIEINPDAVEIAKAMDTERSNGFIRGLLHGIPILLKDNIDTGDQMQTTAGSLAMQGHKASDDAFLVKKLREAGAIILGKTNLSEWSNFRSNRSISGWSSRGGQTKNPYILDQTPCGSSSGSAVAVSADLCVVAVGTSTDGSIACPASFNGVVGIEPTYGLISISGIIPVSKSLDTPGAFGRTVADATILLNAMIGENALDPTTKNTSAKSKRDYLPYLKPNGLKGKRIGVEKTMMESKEGIGALLQDAIAKMKEQGAEIIVIEYGYKYHSLSHAQSKVLQYEFKDGINSYLATAKGPMKSLEEIIRYNSKEAGTVMPYFQQDLMLAAYDRGDLQNEEYLHALAELRTLQPFLADIMTHHQLDAICGIGSGTYGPPAASGCPLVTLPAGDLDGLPIGITFFSIPFNEAVLLSIAYSYEQASQKRSSPRFLPRSEDKL